MDSAWWINSVIYELYVDRFAGNFAGLTDKLDYFTYLGINTIWLLPHYPSPLVDDGYDISDYRGIRPDLGSMDDFDRFIAAARSKGLKVIIDLVLNHTSDAHPWFVESRSSRDNPRRDWYLWSDNQNRFSGAFVHFADQKGSNWIYNEPTGDYYYASFYPQQPDLNWDNPDVRQAMFDVADYWLDKGVSGFRLDAVARLVKRDGTNCYALPETHEILKRLRAHVDAKYPGTVLLAETGGWPGEARTFFGSGDECHLVLNFPLAVELLSAVTTRDLSRVNAVWDQSGGIPDTCRWGVFLTNHDSVDLFFLSNEDQKRQLSAAGNPNFCLTAALSMPSLPKRSVSIPLLIKLIFSALKPRSTKCSWTAAEFTTIA